MCCNQLIKILGATDSEGCFDNSNVAKENGKEFRINTKKTLCRIKNDGCLTTSNTENKCDYIFKVCETSEILLVELKGGDFATALDQIIASYKKIYSKLIAGHPAYKGYIISSSVPAAAEQKFRKLKEKCKKDHNLIVDKKHFKCEIII